MNRKSRYLYSTILSLGLVSLVNPLYAHENSSLDLGTIQLPSVQVNSDVIDALRIYEARKNAPIGVGSVITKDPQLQQQLVKLAGPWVNPDSLVHKKEDKLEIKEPHQLTIKQIERFIQAAEEYKEQIKLAEENQQLDAAIKQIESQAEELVAISEPDEQPEAQAEIKEDNRYKEMMVMVDNSFIGPRELVGPRAQIVIAKKWVNPDSLPYELEPQVTGWNGLVDISLDEAEAEELELESMVVVDDAFIEQQQQEIVSMVERSVPEFEGNTVSIMSPWQSPDEIAQETSINEYDKPVAILDGEKIPEHIINDAEIPERNVMTMKRELEPSKELANINKIEETIRIKAIEVKTEMVMIEAAYIPMPAIRPSAVPVRPEILAAIAKKKAKEEAERKLKVSPIARKVKNVIEKPIVLNQMKAFLKKSLLQEKEVVTAAKVEKKVKKIAAATATVTILPPKPKQEAASNKSRVEEALEVAKNKPVVKQPEVAKKAQLEELRHSVQFTGEDISLEDQEKQKLSSVITEHLSSGDKKYRIIGYAYDNAKQNSGYSARRISLQRAIAIRNYLIKSGVDSVKINVQIVNARADAKGSEFVDVVVR